MKEKSLHMYNDKVHVVKTWTVESEDPIEHYLKEFSK